jgi:hypothetical protein
LVEELGVQKRKSRNSSSSFFFVFLLKISGRYESLIPSRQLVPQHNFV